MGDFNNTPEKILKNVRGKYFIKYTSVPTHNSGKILDFALCSFDANIINSIEYIIPATGSDHLPIIIEINI